MLWRFIEWRFYSTFSQKAWETFLFKGTFDLTFTKAPLGYVFKIFLFGFLLAHPRSCSPEARPVSLESFFLLRTSGIFGVFYSKNSKPNGRESGVQRSA